MRADTKHTLSSGETISPLSQAAIAYQMGDRDNLKLAHGCRSLVVSVEIKDCSQNGHCY